jgi:hypothetical protein
MFNFAETVIWMKGGTMPVACMIREIQGDKALIRIIKGTKATDKTVKVSSLQKSE